MDKLDRLYIKFSCALFGAKNKLKKGFDVPILIFWMILSAIILIVIFNVMSKGTKSWGQSFTNMVTN